MPLSVLKFNPGVVKDITEYSAGNAGPFWTDSNLIRFKNGFPSKIGGWQLDDIFEVSSVGGSASTTRRTITGIARQLISWRALSDGNDRIAIGTHNHLYILVNNALHDITPLRKTSSNLTNPVATSSGSTTVTITDNSHGATTGDFVVINDATATGGVTADTLNQFAGYEITVVDSNSYTITVSSAATSTVSAGGGTSIDVKYLIGNSAGLGSQSAASALGWGVGGWGESTWNTPRSISSTDVVLETSTWDLALWGEDLIANVRGHGIYYWDLSGGVGARAVLVSGIAGATAVPTKARASIISFPDRHLIIGGSDPYVAASGTSSGTLDPMLVRWSTQEDFVKFAPTTDNTAGDQRLEIGTKIVSMIASREETVISTDEAIYGMSFVGPPFIFSFRLLAAGGVGANGLNSMTNADDVVYWMGRSNFFVYNGKVSELPCSVQYYVFDRINKNFIDKTIAGNNKKFKEVTWWYVSTSNTDNENPEPDSYVTFNYESNIWYVGTMDRTAWSDAAGAKTTPFAVDSSGQLYDHETGTSDNGSAMNAFITSSPREIVEGGENLYLVDKLVPDATLTSDTNLYVELKSRKYPNATEITKGPFTITNSTTKVSTRAKGRQMRIKFYSSGTEDNWTLGDFRVNARIDGER
jgi:hypothetical protein